MKQLIITVIMALMATLASAQNTWEMPEEPAQAVNPDQKYLGGAVTTDDKGKVCWTRTIQAPGKSAAEVQDIVRTYLKKMIAEPNQTEQSRIAIDDPETHQTTATVQEWLVFKSTALVLDRTRLFYVLSADCADGRAELKLTNVAYLYEEERDPQTYKAEEWITDRYALNKKQTKLSRITGKFRRKTIDRKDYLFDKIESLLR